MNDELEKDEAPARGYLINAGIPAGLLLWLGSRWVLKRVGDNPVYQREAGETLILLQWLKGIGMALALGASLVFLWGFRKLFWRQKN